ncbi:MAG: hypothetical protein ABSA58_05245 [Acetobacteraceae bacterium]
MTCRQLVFGLVPLCLIAAATVHAEDDASRIFRSFGLEGVWSPDCDHAPSRENPRVYWQLGNSGPITHAVTFDGKTFAVIDTISAASRLNDNQIRFSVVRDRRVALTVTVERKGGKIHTLSSVGADGTIYYRNGIEMATGNAGLFDQRCDGAPPIS